VIENWLPVVGWEGRYEVSDQGHVARLGRVVNGPHGSTIRLPRKALKPRPTGNGHLTVILTGEGGERKAKSVHLLVLEAHVGPRPEGMVACHGPGGKHDNHVHNLRWDTQSSNIRDTLADGTHPSGAGPDHCSQGHEFTPENTYWRRGCRTCEADRSRRKRNLKVI
jgi:hypothetical protein